MTIEELSKWTGVGERTLMRWRRFNGMPAEGNARYLSVDPDAFAEWACAYAWAREQVTGEARVALNASWRRRVNTVGGAQADKFLGEVAL